jgi:hypothetical protein
VGPETPVHKITNAPVFFIYALGLNDFLFGLLKGWALKSQLFWTQMSLALLDVISGPKKVSIFRAQPLPISLVMDVAHYATRHINKKKQKKLKNC